MSITSQPDSQPPMEKDAFYKRALKKVSTKEGWFGDYDYKYMCLPQFPYGKHAVKKNPPFYSLHADLPLLLAIVCGESAVWRIADKCRIPAFACHACRCHYPSYHHR